MVPLSTVFLDYGFYFLVLYFLQHFICDTDLYHHAGLYMFYMALEYVLSVFIFLKPFLLYIITTDSEPRCHSSGVSIFWYGVSLAHVAQFSSWCRADELAHLLVLSGYSLLMGFPQFAWCVQVLQFICAQNPVEIPCEICV